MSLKLFTNKSDVRERKIIAAGMGMFEVWVDDELVLRPIEQAPECIKEHLQFYKTMYHARKVFDELGLEYVK